MTEPEGRPGTVFLSGADRADGLEAEGSLLNQIRSENEELFETLQHFLSLHEKILRIRELKDPAEAYSTIFQLLKTYLNLETFAVFLRESGKKSFCLTFQETSTAKEIRSNPRSNEDSIPSTFPFTDEEREQAMRDLRTVVKNAEDSAAAGEYDGVPTAVLTPLAYRDRAIGFAVLGIRAPTSRLPGIRLQMAEYLLKELAAFVAHWKLSSDLQRMATLNRGIIESVRQGVLAVDASGKILCSNPVANMILVKPAENPVGRHYDTVLSGEMIPVIRECLQKADHKDPLSARPIEFADNKGRVFPLVVWATPLEIEGKGNSGWVFVFQDTSLDQELQHLRKLDVLKSEYFLGLVHDMKTPLTGIISGCDLLMVSGDSFTGEECEVLKIIEASAERLQNLANNFLELSSLESTGGDEPMESADLTDIAQQAMEPFVFQSQKHQIHYEKPPEPILLYCQPRCISRIFENLIGNAMKYSPQGGNIWVRVARLENMASISVKDEGIGIKKQDLARIWESFHRASGLNVQGIEGTGLGLSIIKMIVDKHKGRVSVESHIGKGSTFSVHVPILAPLQTAEAVSGP